MGSNLHETICVLKSYSTKSLPENLILSFDYHSKQAFKQKKTSQWIDLKNSDFPEPKIIFIISKKEKVENSFNHLNNLSIILYEDIIKNSKILPNKESLIMISSEIRNNSNKIANLLKITKNELIVVDTSTGINTSVSNQIRDLTKGKVVKLIFNSSKKGYAKIGNTYLSSKKIHENINYVLEKVQDLFPEKQIDCYNLTVSLSFGPSYTYEK
jgi:ribosomal protein L1